MEIFLVILSLVLVLVGLVGLLVPVMPGILFVFAGCLVLTYPTGFTVITPETALFLGLLAVVTLVADYVAGPAFVRKRGASPHAVIGAVIGGIVGLVLASLPGLIAGQFLGAVLGEMYARGDRDASMKAGVSVLLGFLLGTGFRLLVGIVMASVYIRGLVILIGSFLKGA